MSYTPYIKLLRPKHYLKNILIFLPLVFSGYLLESDYLVKAAFAFVAFSCVASAVYIINDLKDRELDFLHPKKKYRPIASGDVSTRAAILILVLLLGAAGAIGLFADFSAMSFCLLSIYLLTNIFYSFGLKNIPILDVAILSLGFVLRVFYGAFAVDVEVSKWLYLSILVFSLYLALGKRRNEIRINGHETRRVNRHYNQEFLDKNMYVFLGLTTAFYSLWAIEPAQKHPLVFWSIPVFIVLVMSYSLAVESSNSDGDPVNVILSSKPLQGLAIFYGILVALLVYV